MYSFWFSCLCYVSIALVEVECCAMFISCYFSVALAMFSFALVLL